MIQNEPVAPIGLRNMVGYIAGAHTPACFMPPFQGLTSPPNYIFYFLQIPKRGWGARISGIPV